MNVDLSSTAFYEEVISRFVNNELPREVNRISVTELVGCLRAAYLRRVRPARFTGPQVIRVFMGRAVHYALEKLINDYLGNSHAEVKRELELNIEGDKVYVIGKADLIQLGEEGVIVEVKVTGQIPEQPYSNHKKQLQYYLALFDISKGVLLYIDRNGKLRTFTVNRDPRLLAEVISRARQLYLALKHNRLPEPERSNTCYFCPYKWQCLKSREAKEESILV